MSFYAATKKANENMSHSILTCSKYQLHVLDFLRFMALGVGLTWHYLVLQKNF